MDISRARLLHHSVDTARWPTQEPIPHWGAAGAAGGPGGPRHHPAVLLLHHQGGGGGGVQILSRTAPIVSNLSAIFKEVKTITFIFKNPATDTLHDKH